MRRRTAVGWSLALAVACIGSHSAIAQGTTTTEYRVLATNRTSTLERELNEAAEGGYRFNRRDYAYELFWVTFPLADDAGVPVFAQGVTEVELLVRIYDKEGRVRWTVPGGENTR